MKVLISCEESQEVCKAFRAKGTKPTPATFRSRPVGRARKSRNFLYAVHASGCPQNCSREPGRHHEQGVQESRPDHSSVLLCRKRRGYGELSHKAHLPLAEKPAASGTEKQLSTARACVRLKWGKAQENQLVRRNTRNAKRPRGPRKSQKQNCAGHCKGHVRTMGVNR